MIDLIKYFIDDRVNNHQEQIDKVAAAVEKLALFQLVTIDKMKAKIDQIETKIEAMTAPMHPPIPARFIEIEEDIKALEIKIEALQVTALAMLAC